MCILYTLTMGSCNHGMARPQVADWRNGLQIWSVVANILKQSRTADERWSSGLEVGPEANN